MSKPIPSSVKSLHTSEEFDVSEFSDGHENFLETHYNANIEHYKNLVVPNFITGALPGEIFIYRNIGNYIPPFETKIHGVGAAIEFAVMVLGVKEIIVLGHSHCGACQALSQDLDEKKFPHLRPWIDLNKKTKETVEKLIKNGEIKEEEKREMTEKINVLNQIDNLMTYPYVKERVQKGELHLTAWHFAIETGEIEYYERKSHSFKKFKKEKSTEPKSTETVVIEGLSAQVETFKWTTVGLLGILGVAAAFIGYQHIKKNE